MSIQWRLYVKIINITLVIFFSHLILNKILFFSVLSESLSTLTTLIRIFIFVFIFNLHLFDSFSGVCILMCLKVYSGACLLRNLPFFSHFRWMGLAKSFFQLFLSSILNQLIFFCDWISVVDCEQMRLTVVYLCMCVFGK